MTVLIYHEYILEYAQPCLVPKRLSLDKNVRAKEGGSVCTLPMVPCGSSLVVRLYLAKNEVPEEEAVHSRN